MLWTLWLFVKCELQKSASVAEKLIYLLIKNLKGLKQRLLHIQSGDDKGFSNYSWARFAFELSISMETSGLGTVRGEEIERDEVNFRLAFNFCDILGGLFIWKA